MSSTPPPIHTPRGINDLPVELKKYIVTCAADQDKVYETWSSSLVESFAFEGAMDAVFMERRKRHRSAITALFCVSKEWSDLAAPLLFKVRLFPFSVPISQR